MAITAVTPDAFLRTQLRTVIGQPLRIAVYSRIAEGIRSEVFRLGTPLPKESELGQALGVSRTVVREALMLLEEDGLITTRRGIGRFVTDQLPHIGLEEFRPLDAVLAEPDRPVQVRAIEFGRQPTTDFISSNLGLDDAANTWFREAIASRDGEPIAIIQEHLPAGRYLNDISVAIAHNLQSAAEQPCSLLAGLIKLCSPPITDAVCHIATNVAGVERGKLLNVGPADPVLILTQTAKVDGKPFYLAKAVISTRVGHLAIVQTGL